MKRVISFLLILALTMSCLTMVTFATPSQTPTVAKITSENLIADVAAFDSPDYNLSAMMNASGKLGNYGCTLIDLADDPTAPGAKVLHYVPGYRWNSPIFYWVDPVNNFINSGCIYPGTNFSVKISFDLYVTTQKYNHADSEDDDDKVYHNEDCPSITLRDSGSGTSVSRKDEKGYDYTLASYKYDQWNTHTMTISSANLDARTAYPRITIDYTYKNGTSNKPDCYVKNLSVTVTYNGIVQGEDENLPTVIEDGNFYTSFEQDGDIDMFTTPYYGLGTIAYSAEQKNSGNVSLKFTGASASTPKAESASPAIKPDVTSQIITRPGKYRLTCWYYFAENFNGNAVTNVMFLPAARNNASLMENLGAATRLATVPRQRWFKYETVFDISSYFIGDLMLSLAEGAGKISGDYNAVYYVDDLSIEKISDSTETVGVYADYTVPNNSNNVYYAGSTGVFTLDDIKGGKLKRTYKVYNPADHQVSFELQWQYNFETVVNAGRVKPQDPDDNHIVTVGTTAMDASTYTISNTWYTIPSGSQGIVIPAKSTKTFTMPVNETNTFDNEGLLTVTKNFKFPDPENQNNEKSVDFDVKVSVKDIFVRINNADFKSHKDTAPTELIWLTTDNATLDDLNSKEVALAYTANSVYIRPAYDYEVYSGKPAIRISEVNNNKCAIVKHALSKVISDGATEYPAQSFKVYNNCDTEFAISGYYKYNQWTALKGEQTPQSIIVPPHTYGILTVQGITGISGRKVYYKTGDNAYNEQCNINDVDLRFNFVNRDNIVKGDSTFPESNTLDIIIEPLGDMAENFKTYANDTDMPLTEATCWYIDIDELDEIKASITDPNYQSLRAKDCSTYNGWDYIHGGTVTREQIPMGDDTENWAMHLTPITNYKYSSIYYRLSPEIIQSKEDGYNGHGAGSYKLSFKARLDDNAVNNDVTSGTFLLYLNSKAHMDSVSENFQTAINKKGVYTYFGIQYDAVLGSDWKTFTVYFNISQDYLDTLKLIKKGGYYNSTSKTDGETQSANSLAYDIGLRIDGSGTFYKYKDGDPVNPNLEAGYGYYVDDIEFEYIGREITITAADANYKDYITVSGAKKVNDKFFGTVGDTVTLQYSDPTGNTEFNGITIGGKTIYADENGKVTFSMGNTSTTVNLIVKNQNSNEVWYYIDGKLQKIIDFTDDMNADQLAHLDKYGYEFVSFTYKGSDYVDDQSGTAEENLLQALTDEPGILRVDCNYKKITEFNVTASYPISNLAGDEDEKAESQADGSFKLKTKLTLISVEAPATTAQGKFVCWKDYSVDKTGKVVSNNRKYSVWVTRDMNLVAVYSNGADETKEQYLDLFFKNNNGGFSIVSEREFSDAVIISHGIKYVCLTEASAAMVDAKTNDDEKRELIDSYMTVKTATINTLRGTYILTKKTIPANAVYYAYAFVEYKEIGSSEVKTKCSAIVKYPND